MPREDAIQHRDPGNAGNVDIILREAIQKKNLLLFGFFQFRLEPPAPDVFWNPSSNFFSKPDFIRTKVPQSVWTLVIPPNLT